MFRALIMLFGFLLIHTPSRAVIGTIVNTITTAVEAYRPYSYAGIGGISVLLLIVMWPTQKSQGRGGQLVVESRQVIRN